MVMERIFKPMLTAAGIVCVGLGVIGIFVPLLPTTPFLLLAAICFARSSPRLLHWLNHNRWFGSYIRNYREGRGIPRREKIVTIAALWLTIGISVIFFITMPWVKFLLIAIALAVTVHLALVKNFKPVAKQFEEIQFTGDEMVDRGNG